MRMTAIVKCVAAAGLLFGAAVPCHAAGNPEPNPWSQINGEASALSLEDTIFAGKPVSATANVHVNGSRNDWIKAGSLTAAEPNITMMVSRLSEPKPIMRTVIAALEELTEIRASQPRYRPSYYKMTTRFGDLRGVMFDIDADGVRKYCVGFHKPAVDPVFVKGYVCAPSLAQAAPQDVACLIDKVRHTGIPRAATGDALPACGAMRLDPDNPPPDQTTGANRL